jgi:hypothetical protein
MSPAGRSAQHRDHGFGDVGQVRRDAVTGRDPRSREGGRCACGQRMQLEVRHAPPHICLAPEHQGIRCVVGALALEQVLRKVESGFGEPCGARHPVFVRHHDVARRSNDAGVIPDFAPEQSLVRDRPAPERVVSRDVDAVAGADLRSEGGQIGRRYALRRRFPERARGRHHVNRWREARP